MIGGSDWIQLFQMVKTNYIDICGIIKNSEYKKLSIILKWLDAIAGICVIFTLKKSTIWYVEVIDVN